MTWEERVIAADGDLNAAVEALFADQLERWDLLRAGADGLERARSLAIELDGFRLSATHIPHRIHSTTAEVDAQSIRSRPCFLCPENLPGEERGVAFGEEFVVTANPYPIRERHLSIVSREHRPQRALGDFPAMLDLAAALPAYLVLYNGPECGASAPDHMHFQACLRAGVPLVDALGRGSPSDGYPASYVRLAGPGKEDLADRFAVLLARLRDVAPGEAEPKVNVVAVRDADRWQVLVFPRRAHRPSMYASGELLWSPGALDLAGILVLPRESDLERVTPDMFREGFSEVSVPAQVAKRLEREIAA